MYLMYVDESGDSGLNNSPTRYFVLSGLVVHELRWQSCLERLIQFRRRMREKFGLKLREEIHSAALINSPGELVRVRRNDRLTLLRMYADEIAGMPDISIINVIVDKQGKPDEYDVFEKAWQALLQRFENTPPNTYMKKKSGQNYYKRLEGLFCRQASTVDPLGIVRL